MLANVRVHRAKGSEEQRKGVTLELPRLKCDSLALQHGDDIANGRCDGDGVVKANNCTRGANIETELKVRDDCSTRMLPIDETERHGPRDGSTIDVTRIGVERVQLVQLIRRYRSKIRNHCRSRTVFIAVRPTAIIWLQRWAL